MPIYSGSGGFVRSANESPIANILANNEGLVTREIVVDQNETLVQGDVLGKITIGGLYIKSLLAAVDGSEVPIAILVDDEITTAAAENKRASAIVGGQIQKSKVGLGTGHTLANVETKLQDVGLYLVTSYDEGGFSP